LKVYPSTLEFTRGVLRRTPTLMALEQDGRIRFLLNGREGVLEPLPDGQYYRADQLYDLTRDHPGMEFVPLGPGVVEVRLRSRERKRILESEGDSKNAPSAQEREPVRVASAETPVPQSPGASPAPSGFKKKVVIEMVNGVWREREVILNGALSSKASDADGAVWGCYLVAGQNSSRGEARPVSYEPVARAWTDTFETEAVASSLRTQREETASATPEPFQKPLPSERGAPARKATLWEEEGTVAQTAPGTLGTPAPAWDEGVDDLKRAYVLLLGLMGEDEFPAFKVHDYLKRLGFDPVKTRRALKAKGLLQERGAFIRMVEKEEALEKRGGVGEL